MQLSSERTWLQYHIEESCNWDSSPPFWIYLSQHRNTWSNGWKIVPLRWQHCTLCKLCPKFVFCQLRSFHPSLKSHKDCAQSMSSGGYLCTCKINIRSFCHRVKSTSKSLCVQWKTSWSGTPRRRFELVQKSCHRSHPLTFLGRRISWYPYRIERAAL